MQQNPRQSGQGEGAGVPSTSLASAGSVLTHLPRSRWQACGAITVVVPTPP